MKHLFYFQTITLIGLRFFSTKKIIKNKKKIISEQENFIFFKRRARKKKKEILLTKQLPFKPFCKKKKPKKIIIKAYKYHLFDNYQTGNTKINNTVGLIANEPGYVTNWEIRAFYMAFKREIRRRRYGRIERSIRRFLPITVKTKGARMGKGRGRTYFRVSPIMRGQVLIRIRFIHEKNVHKVLYFLYKLKQKLRLRTILINFSKLTHMYKYRHKQNDKNLLNIYKAYCYIANKNNNALINKYTQQIKKALLYYLIFFTPLQNEILVSYNYLIDVFFEPNLFIFEKNTPKDLTLFDII